jgi:hypothetical protein
VAGQVNSYDVIVSREGKFWVAVVDGVRGGATESRRLANLEVEVRDLLAGLLDTDPDDLDLNFQMAPALSCKAYQALQDYRAASEKLAESKRQYEDAQQQAVGALQSAQVSVRDAAYLTHLSFQRIAQLTGSGVSGSTSTKRAAAKSAGPGRSAKPAVPRPAPSHKNAPAKKAPAKKGAVSRVNH